jgi:2-polyprenyl-3-methyl-5-hydroxy-6-metoxy-1,4-benzoquinol methylase
MSYEFENNPEFHVWDLADMGQLDSKEQFKSGWYSRHLKSNEAILDIGCGPGYMVKMFHDNGIKVLGVDLNEVLVNKAQQAGLPVIKMDALEAIHSYKDEYSFFHMSDFVEHVPLSVVVKILQAISQVKNAKIFIATPNLDSLMGFKFWFHMPTHINAMNPYVIRQMLNKLGFTITEEWSEYGNLPGRGWKLKLRQFILRKLLGTQADLFTGGANVCFIARTNK